jgi:hypothetical protein
MLNDTKIKAILNPLLPEIEQAQREFTNLCLGAKSSGQNVISYLELLKVFKNKKKILTFLKDYANTGHNFDFYASHEKSSLKDFWLDIRYQRITDLLKCFENIIKVEGFDGTLAEPLMTFRSYGQKDGWRITDGGHRVIMLYLVGETEYPINPTTHTKGMTTEQEVETEAQRFVVKNSITNVVQFISIFKAWLCFPKNSSEYEDSQSVLKTLAKANLDVSHGYFFADSPRIAKLQEIYGDLLKTVKKGANHYKYYSADAFISASQIIQKAYKGCKEVIIEDLLCIARMIEKSNDGVFDEFNVEDVPSLNAEAIAMAYIKYAEKYPMGHLTKDTLQKNKLASLDYNVMNTLFKLKKKDKNYLETLWNPTIEE